MVKKKCVYSITGYDKIIIVLILIFSIAAAVYKSEKRQAGANQRVLIYKNNILIKQVELKEDANFNLGQSGISLEIKDSAVKVLSADCPHKTCVNRGVIRYPGESIICVPNQIIIEIEAEGHDSVDAVCY